MSAYRLEFQMTRSECKALPFPSYIDFTALFQIALLIRSFSFMPCFIERDS